MTGQTARVSGRHAMTYSAHRERLTRPVRTVRPRHVRYDRARIERVLAMQQSGARPCTRTVGTDPSMRAEHVPTGTVGSTARRKSAAKMTGAMKSPDGRQSAWAMPGYFRTAVTTDSRWSDTVSNTWQRAA